MTPTGTAVINACKWESYSVSLEISLYNLYTYVKVVFPPVIMPYSF